MLADNKNLLRLDISHNQIKYEVDKTHFYSQTALNTLTYADYEAI